MTEKHWVYIVTATGECWRMTEGRYAQYLMHVAEGRSEAMRDTVGAEYIGQGVSIIGLDKPEALKRLQRDVSWNGMKASTGRRLRAALARLLGEAA